MAAFQKFNQFVEDLARKVHNLNTDVLKVALTNTAPLATNAVLANITEVAAGNGYPAGGAQATFVSGAQAGGAYKLVLNDVVFTASGGAIGPFRYVVLYNDTPTSPTDPLIGFADFGSPLTIAAGNTFTVDLDQVNGALAIS